MTDSANDDYNLILGILESIAERLQACTVNDPELEEVGLGNVAGDVWLRECFGVELATEAQEIA